MQSPQHPNEGKRSFHELPTTIRFSFQLDGKVEEASITHVQHEQQGGTFRVFFSDGHVGVFFPVEGTPYWHEEDVGPSSYAIAVTDDLNALAQFDLQSPPLLVRIVKRGKALNVWVRQHSGAYDVYYEGDHRFSIYETNLGWDVLTVGRHYGYVNEDIRTIVEHHLTTRKT